MTADPKPQLPPSYWIAQIRADLKSRRLTQCGHGPKCSDCPKETDQ